MIKIKKGAFTLSEVLITLAVVGTLAALVVPGLIKDVNSKAMMALLQGTISNLNNAVQTELVKTGATNLESTDIKNNPKKFFEKLDVVKASADASNFANFNEYKTLNGTKLTALPNTCQASAKLKNGVTLCMSTFEPLMSRGEASRGKNASTIYIDLNGDNQPNIAGVDLWGIYIYPITVIDRDLPAHVGDIAGVPTSTTAGKSCNTNSRYSPIGCYSQAEQSGFDHNYWKKL